MLNNETWQIGLGLLTTPNLARRELIRSYSPTKRVLKRSYYDKIPRITILLMINRRVETLGLINCLLFHLFFASRLLSRLSRKLRLHHIHVRTTLLLHADNSSTFEHPYCSQSVFGHISRTACRYRLAGVGAELQTTDMITVIKEA